MHDCGMLENLELIGRNNMGSLRNLRIQGRGSAMGKDDFLRAGLKTLHFLLKL